MPEGENQKPSDNSADTVLSAADLAKKGGLKGWIPLPIPNEQPLHTAEEAKKVGLGNTWTPLAVPTGTEQQQTLPVRNVTTGQIEEIPGLGFSKEPKQKEEPQNS